MKKKHIVSSLFMGILLSLCACGAFSIDNKEENLQKAAEERAAGESETGVKAFTDDPRAIEVVAGSVVKVEVYGDHDQKIGTGSGFCAFDPAVLVTAAHVIVNMDHAIVTCDNGEAFRVEKAVDGEKESDVAIFQLPEEVKLSPLPVSINAPLRGEKIVAIGSQFSVLNLVTLGNMAGTWNSKEIDWLLFTAPVSAGSSGGPILNDRGEVIGIISSTYDKGQNLNLASPISEAKEIYDLIYKEGELEK